MKISSAVLAKPDRMPKWRASSHYLRRSNLSAMKARQSAKIREIAEALVSAGFITLDGQAKALGLGRSTTWAVLKNSYKNSGISATIIDRILSSPRLPPPVSTKIIEYVEEKVAGLYGHGQVRRRRFVDLLGAKLAEHGRLEDVPLQPAAEVIALFSAKPTERGHRENRPASVRSGN